MQPDKTVVENLIQTFSLSVEQVSSNLSSVSICRFYRTLHHTLKERHVTFPFYITHSLLYHWLEERKVGNREFTVYDGLDGQRDNSADEAELTVGVNASRNH